jgi:hypothetical protein
MIGFRDMREVWAYAVQGTVGAVKERHKSLARKGVAQGSSPSYAHAIVGQGGA